ncbi:MAG: maleylacetate reductase [Ilumatobacteraceae bacterium]
MKPFTYTQLPARVVFGAGARRQLAAEVEALRGDRVMLIAQGDGDEMTDLLGGRVVLRWDEIVQHVPLDLAERAREAAVEAGIDAIVSVGGGSATGLAKAVALTVRRPIVAVPTTYAGSEQTTIYGLTGDRHKQTGKSLDVLPRSVIYDPELTLGIPAGVTGPSAFNALAHSVEALYAPGRNPVISALALEAVTAIRESLPVVMASLRDIDARGRLLYGAYLSGVALGSTSAAFHHKICHVLGGTFNLVHADAHSVILPHAVAFNAPALPDEMALLGAALGGEAAGALWDLAVASNVPTSLEALGLTAADLPEAAERSAAEVAKIAAPGTPRSCSTEQMLALLQRAFEGRRPTPGDAE